MTSGPFTDAVAVVTGGSQGIGRELALQLADQRARVVLASRNAERLDDAVRACRDRGAEAIGVPTDVAKSDECRRLIEQAAAGFGQIDLLINNAGVAMWSRFARLEDPQILVRLMEVNFFGAMYCTYYALPHLLESQGRIVAVSSLAGRLASPTGSGYVASKYAMRGFFDSLRIELQPERVSVTVVYPGLIDTGVYERFVGSDGKPVDIGDRVPKRTRLPVDKCVRSILAAAQNRKRELIVPRYGKLLSALSIVAPRLRDRLMRRVRGDY